MDAAEGYTRRLRDVFDVCDVDKRGYISIDHFVKLANEHFGTSGRDSDNQEVCHLLRYIFGGIFGVNYLVDSGCI